ncbi:MAG: hypothetical protein GY913_13745 [Proteobacteria bacterium]|nr:hypothetical protein [Pseudomonadota bacterium]MCP4917971.1 hypothetical protein [Pseudomonadota bacterium]
MSEHTPETAETDDLAKIGFEPDDVPVDFLFKTTIALTVSVVLMVGFTYWYFKKTVAEELQAKGYDVTEQVPRGEFQ